MSVSENISQLLGAVLLLVAAAFPAFAQEPPVTAASPEVPAASPTPQTIPAPQDVPQSIPSATATPAGVSVVLPGLGNATIGGYGEAYYDREEGGNDSATGTLRRVVLYVGHEFNDKIRFYSEFEVENAREAEFEQGYLDFAITPTLAIRAGLQLVPMGIINITHEPPTFLTVDRPTVDQLIIPSTWRELGVAAVWEPIEDLKLTGLVANGLNGAQINGDLGLVGARGQGNNANYQQLSGSLRATYEPILGVTFGASGYYGGASAGNSALSGVNVGIAEADAQLKRDGFVFRAEYVRVMVSNAAQLTLYLQSINPSATSIGSASQGYYAELGYDVLRLASPGSGMQVIPFVRYESDNLHAQLASVPNPGSGSDADFVGAGVDWRVDPRVVLKADWRHFVSKGIVPPVGDLEDEQETGVATAGGTDRLMLGIGFSF